jgi:hypothetical protein
MNVAEIEPEMAWLPKRDCSTSPDQDITVTECHAKQGGSVDNRQGGSIVHRQQQSLKRST